jgi:multicomponent K+:H+ antiporter subunit G
VSGLELPAWAAIPAAALLVCGALLALVAACGLLRLRSFYERMHPPTMGTTLGAGCVLVASMIVSSAVLERPVVHEVVITLFILISAPVSAMTLMRAAVSRTRERTEKAGDLPA